MYLLLFANIINQLSSNLLITNSTAFNSDASGPIQGLSPLTNRVELDMVLCSNCNSHGFLLRATFCCSLEQAGGSACGWSLPRESQVLAQRVNGFLYTGPLGL